MATVTGVTADKMREILDGTVVDAKVVGDNLILIRNDGSQVDAGSVRGPKGTDAAPGSVAVAPGTTIIRTSDSRAKAANPTASDDLTTKAYVDGILNPFMGQWTAQVPEWRMEGSTSLGGPGSGGSLIGRYLILGRTLFWEGELTLGTGISVVAGARWLMGLPKIGGTQLRFTGLFTGSLLINSDGRLNYSLNGGFTPTTAKDAMFLMAPQTATANGMSGINNGSSPGGIPMAAGGTFRWNIAGELA